MQFPDGASLVSELLEALQKVLAIESWGDHALHNSNQLYDCSSHKKYIVLEVLDQMNILYLSLEIYCVNQKHSPMIYVHQLKKLHNYFCFLPE